MVRSSPVARKALPESARALGAALSDEAFDLEPTRLRLLLGHLSTIEDPREPHTVTHPPNEMLLLAVCGTIVGCDDYDAIAEWARSISSFCGKSCPSTTEFRAVSG